MSKICVIVLQQKLRKFQEIFPRVSVARGKPEKPIACRAWSLVNVIRVNICAWKFSSNHWSSHSSPSRRVNSKGKLDQPYAASNHVRSTLEKIRKQYPTLSSIQLSFFLQNWALTNIISSLFLADLFPAASYLPSSHFSSLPNLSSVKENLQGKKLQQQCFQWKINPIFHTTISMLIMPTRLLWGRTGAWFWLFSQTTLILRFSFYLAYLIQRQEDYKRKVKFLSFHQSQKQS